MNYTKIQIKEDTYFIGSDDVEITFIGSPNGNIEEINQWFKHAQYVDNIDVNEKIKVAIQTYLSGKTKKIDLPMSLHGTEFQKKVWNQLLKIPYGETKTYSEIAESMGSVKKVRAVASAIAKNPLLIIVPCHRVIGLDGNLRGFRAGIEFKKELLNLEREHRNK